MVVAGLSPREKVGWCFGSSVWATTVTCLCCRQSQGLRETWALDRCSEPIRISELLSGSCSHKLRGLSGMLRVLGYQMASRTSLDLRSGISVMSHHSLPRLWLSNYFPILQTRKLRLRVYESSPSPLSLQSSI